MIRSAFLAAMLTACGVATTPTPLPTPEPIVITGTFTLRDPGGIAIVREVGTRYPISCEGTGGYSDVTEGLGVVITDQDGRTIATDRLTQEGMEREQIGTDDTLAPSPLQSRFRKPSSIPSKSVTEAS